MSSTEHSLLEKLGETLDTHEDLSFLADLGTDKLQKLEKVLEDYQHRTQAAQRPVYEVMAKAVVFIPNMIIAKLAQDYLSPYIIAQVTPFLKAKDSAKIGRSLKADFLGRVTTYVEPALTADIATHMGMPYIFNVFQEMAKLEYWLRLGEITDLLSDNVLKPVIEKMQDPARVARIVDHMENVTRVQFIARSVKPAMKGQVVDVLKELDSKMVEYFQ